MRSHTDRLRHSLAFEIVGLLLVLPLGMLAFDMALADIGVVGLVSTLVAMAWNYLYNLGFDHILAWRAGDRAPSGRSLPLRLLHAILFEAGLLALLLPFISLYLGISLWQALLMDLGIALFYVGYAFVFNWAYDRLFPLPAARVSDRG